MKKKLKEICNITMGQSPDSSSYNKNSDGMPFFQGNADFGKLYPTIRTWTNCAKKIAKKDDILISVRAPIGALNYTNVNCCIGRGLAAITPFEYVCSKYIFYLLKSQKNNLNAQGIGSTFKAIGRSNLENIEVPELNISAQQKIANHLDSIQTAIDNKQQQLKELDEIVKSRFIEMFGENPVESGKWHVDKMSNICSIQTGGTPSRSHPEYFEGNIPWITTANLGKNELNYEDAMEYITREAIDNSATKIIPANSLFIGIRVGVGKCSINKVDMCSNQDICGLSGFDTKSINLVFLKKVIDSYSIFFENAKRGTTIKGVKSDMIKNLKIFIPDINIQNQFADFVQQIDKSKFVVKQQIADLQELMDSKMQEYFGE